MALKSLSLVKPFIGRPVTQDESISIKLLGLTFPNPIGLAAGFDKDGVALQELASLGFGHIEAGTVTLHAQSGNPKPRLFRLPEDQALINRAGFNNEGAAAFAQHVRTARPDCVLGVSIGKSKITPLEHAIDDYLGSFEFVHNIADYIAVNVSSPNTPQLRELQQADQLTSLLRALQTRNRQVRTTPIPMLVKLSPDLNANELEMILDVVKKENIDGIIATNTTTSRDNLNSTKRKVAACGEGGLSGRPLRSRSTDIVAQIYRLTEGRIPIIGVGGIFTAKDAWEKICAGASLVQLYTGFIYEGPFVARKINRGLLEIMKREGVSHLQDAIGQKANR